MKIDQVPQDPGACYSGFKRVCYAQDNNLTLQRVASIGWLPEIEATTLAYDHFRDHCLEMRNRVEKGFLSPLAYYLASMQLNLNLASSLTGIPVVLIWLHRKNMFFKFVTVKQKQAYSKALGMPWESLCALPQR